MLTSAFVGSIFGGGKTPTLFDAFPELFEKEAEIDHTEKAKKDMIAYAELWNAQRAKKLAQEGKQT